MLHEFIQGATSCVARNSVFVKTRTVYIVTVVNAQQSTAMTKKKLLELLNTTEGMTTAEGRLVLQILLQFGVTKWRGLSSEQVCMFLACYRHLSTTDFGTSYDNISSGSLLRNAYHVQNTDTYQVRLKDWPKPLEKVSTIFLPNYLWFAESTLPQLHPLTITHFRKVL